MVKQDIDVARGYFLWLLLNRKGCANHRILFLVLTGENEKVDGYALEFLDSAMDRKSVEEALVIVSNEEMVERVSRHEYRHVVRTKILSRNNIGLLYKWYCLNDCLDNLIFTFVRTNSDNLLDQFLRETDIDERDVVCLALYKLRHIPENGEIL